LHLAQLMPLPLTVSCFSKIQIGSTFLVPAHLGSPEKGPLNVCVCVRLFYLTETGEFFCIYKGTYKLQLCLFNFGMC